MACEGMVFKKSTRDLISAVSKPEFKEILRRAVFFATVGYLIGRI